MSRSITTFDEFAGYATEQLKQFLQSLPKTDCFELQYITHTVTTYINCLSHAPGAKRKNVPSIPRLLKLINDLNTISPDYLPQLFLPQDNTFVFSQQSAKLIKLMHQLLIDLQSAVQKNSSLLSSSEQTRLKKNIDKLACKLELIERYQQQYIAIEKVEATTAQISSALSNKTIKLEIIKEGLELLKRCPSQITCINGESLPAKIKNEHVKQQYSGYLKFVEDNINPDAAALTLEQLKRTEPQITLNPNRQLRALANILNSAIKTTAPKLQSELASICHQRQLTLQRLPSLKAHLHTGSLKCRLTQQQLTPWTRSLVEGFFETQLLALHANTDNLDVSGSFSRAENWILMCALSMHPSLIKQQQQIVIISLEQLNSLFITIAKAVMSNTDNNIGEQAAKSIFVLACTFKSEATPPSEYQKSRASIVKSTASSFKRTLTRRKHVVPGYTIDGTTVPGIILTNDEAAAVYCWNVLRELFQLMRDCQFDLTPDTLAAVTTLYKELGTALTLLALSLVAEQDCDARQQHIKDMLTVISKLLFSLAIYNNSDETAQRLLSTAHRYSQADIPCNETTPPQRTKLFQRKHAVENARGNSVCANTLKHT